MYGKLVRIKSLGACLYSVVRYDVCQPPAIEI